MIAFLLAILMQPCPSHPLIDEGDRWECATFVGTFDHTGEKQSRLIFWRRDSFNRIWPAGEVDWSEVTWNYDDGHRFNWHDQYEECHRSLRVDRFDYAIVNLERWRVSWPNCPADMRGFLPNPERREPE